LIKKLTLLSLAKNFSGFKLKRVRFVMIVFNRALGAH